MKMAKAKEAEIPEDLHELSVTRKLGHTDMGDESDPFELGLSINASVVMKKDKDKLAQAKKPDEDYSSSFRNPNDDHFEV